MTQTLRAQRRLRLSCSSQIRKLSTRDASRSRPRGTLCLPEQNSVHQLPIATPGWAKFQADAGRNRVTALKTSLWIRCQMLSRVDGEGSLLVQLICEQPCSQCPTTFTDYTNDRPVPGFMLVFSG